VSTRAAFQFGPLSVVITSAGSLGIGGLCGIEWSERRANHIHVISAEEY
jgi:hypothetical protein